MGRTLEIRETGMSSRQVGQRGTSAKPAGSISTVWPSNQSTHRNPPFDLSAGSSFGTAVTDPSSDEGSNTNEQLEGSGESSTIGRMGCGSELFQQAGRRHTDFRLVHWTISIVNSDGYQESLRGASTPRKPIPIPAKNRPASIVPRFWHAVCRTPPMMNITPAVTTAY
jgi:hypothetical protein